MRHISLLAACFCLVLLSGCYNFRRAGPIVDPITLGGASVQRGQKLYNAYCFKCHIAGVGGLGVIALHLEDLERQ